MFEIQPDEKLTIHLLGLWILFSWLLLALQGKGSFVGKIFVLQCSTTNILPPEKSPAMQCIMCLVLHVWGRK